ncbi:L10-interacting MYB domain-containing protein-like [Cucumis melo]|uniref:L10-interacting MYB domain-containing protein-like n=1 Tax=Cucumis melo TaxID=3656 RepID=A0A1S3CRV5_CUCME|nr:L10-interacting MYB domain-containing protein-like [Cucumis melo]
MPETAKFRAKGLQNADQLDILFKDIEVTEDGAWAPSQGFVPQSTEGNSSRYVGENDDTYKDMEHNNTEYSIHTVEDYTQGKGKKRKRIGSKGNVANKLCNQLERVCGSIDNRRRDLPGCSIFEVMNVLWDIHELIKGDELFMKAADIFTKMENREIFVALQEPEIQVAWLKQKKV